LVEIEDHIINIKIHQSQFDELYKILLDTFLESDSRQMVDMLYRTVWVPFRQRGDQLVILLLDKRRQGIIAGFLIKLLLNRRIQSIESIPLNLSHSGQILSEVFKIKASLFQQAAEEAKSILQARYGSLWTLIILDILQISKLYNLLNFEPTKELIGKVAKTIIDRIKDEKIKLLPLPEVVNAIEKIL
jgi:hypothetical protein